MTIQISFFFENHITALILTAKTSCTIVCTTLGTLPLYDWSVSILVLLLLLHGVFQAVEVDGVSDDLLVEELAGHDVFTAEAGDVSLGSEAG